jgi:hypothetical protein
MKTSRWLSFLLLFACARTNPAKNVPAGWVAITPPTVESPEALWAVEIGTKLARERHSDLVTHRRDGSIRERSHHGADPAPPRSRKYRIAHHTGFGLLSRHMANAATDNRSSEVRGVRPRALARLQLS